MRTTTYPDVTIVTDRGQVSIPAHLPAPRGPHAMLGFARRLRPEARTTNDWMRELR